MVFDLMTTSRQRIIGGSQALAQALDHASDLARIERPVLVCGERGSGKELIAERIHYLSGRWDQPLVAVNCAAISDELLESELFGHDQGAFTGANRRHIGRFERADGGTLFLDELGTMSLRVQEKLLRLIEYGTFERLGSSITQQVDVRILAATNADLPKMTKEGKFRADLLDRLAFDVIQVPPLRQRLDDVPELAEFFAIRFTSELGWDYFPGFSDDAINTLLHHHWPGNVRELRNAVERSVFRWNQPDVPVGQIIIDPFQATETPPEPPKPTTQPTSASTPPTTDKPENINLKAATEQLQRTLIQTGLDQHRHNQRAAAKSLQLTYNQFRGLYRKLFRSG